jgi:hypothetical protein
MLKRFKYVVLIVTLGVLLAPAATSAHTFRSDGPVTVLLHVDPNDTPLTHEPSRLNFYVFDAANQFLGTQCTCSVRVTLGNTTILSEPITFHDNGSNHVAQVPIVFPSLGVYQIYLTGRPKGGYVFHAFKLNYLQRVSLVGRAAPTNDWLGTAELVGIGVVIVGGLAVTVRLSRPSKQSAPAQRGKGRHK